MDPSRHSNNSQVKPQQLLHCDSKDMQKLKILLETLKAKYPEAVDYFEEQQEEKINQEQEIASLSKQITIIKERYFNSQKTIDNLKNHLTQLQDTDDQLKQLQIRDQASGLEIENLKNQLTQLQNTDDKLKQLQIREHNSRFEIESLKNQLHQLQETDDQLKQSQVRDRSSRLEIDRLSRELIEIRTHYVSKDRLQQALIEIEEYKTRIAAGELEIESRAAAIAELKKHIHEAEKLEVNLEQQNYQLRQQIAHLELCKDSAVAAQERNLQYEHLLSNQAKDVQTLKSVIEDLQFKLKEAENKDSKILEQAKDIQSLKAFIDTLQIKLNKAEAQDSNLDEQNKKMQSLTAQLQSSHEKNALLNRYLDEAKAQIGRDKTKLEKLSNLLFEKDRSIQELQQLEISLKRSSEIKQDLEKSLEAKIQDGQRLHAEKQQLEADAKDRCLHIEQLERVIQFLRERSQEAQLELNQLRGEYQTAQDAILTLQKQLDVRCSEMAVADKAQMEMDQQKQQALAEITSLQVQQAELKSEIEKLQEKGRSGKAKFENLRTDFELQAKKYGDLELLLAKKNDALAHFDKEIGLIKQTLVRAVREAKEIESLYKETVQEKIHAITKIHQHQQQLEKYREKETFYKKELSKFKDQLQSIQSSVVQIESSRQELNHKLQQQTIEHASEIESLQNLIKTTDKEKQQWILQCKQGEEEAATIKAALTRFEQAQHENELEIQTAQRHLAKKVKDMAVLEDKYHQQQNQFEEMEKIRAQEHIKMVELQTALDVQKEHQLRQEQQFLERLQTAERLQSRWEEKCLTLQSKMNELEKIEERYQQLQLLMSNFGAIMGSAANLPREAEFQKDIKEPEHKEIAQKEAPAANPKVQREENQIMTKPYQNLFDLPKPSGKYKQNLLD